jgi:hypothetical protein
MRREISERQRSRARKAGVERRTQPNLATHDSVGEKEPRDHLRDRAQLEHRVGRDRTRARDLDVAAAQPRDDHTGRRLGRMPGGEGGDVRHGRDGS